MRLFVTVLLFISFAVTCHAESISGVSEKQMNLDEALKMYSTPFIDNYRKRYSHDKLTKYRAVLNAYNTCTPIDKWVNYKIPCTKQDIENIKQLAKYGDEPSLSLASYFIENKNLYSQYAKQAADNGSISGTIIYAYRIMDTNPALGRSYLEKIKASGNIDGYTALLQAYSKYNMTKDFCSIMREGYEKFGFDFISLYSLNHIENNKYSKIKYQRTLFDEYPKVCFNKTFDAILNDEDSNVSMLYKGYMQIIKENYIVAKGIFQKLYDKSNDINLKYDAGFCLGAMYYHGKGVKKNTEQGVKLLKEAINNGYDVLYYIPEISIIPNDAMILRYRGICEYLLLFEIQQKRNW